MMNYSPTKVLPARGQSLDLDVDMCDPDTGYHDGHEYRFEAYGRSGVGRRMCSFSNATTPGVLSEIETIVSGLGRSNTSDAQRMSIASIL